MLESIPAVVTSITRADLADVRVRVSQEEV